MINLYEVCFDSMGVYPEKFGDRKRDGMAGWLECFWL
jgi:hypothetical protein